MMKVQRGLIMECFFFLQDPLPKVTNFCRLEGNVDEVALLTLLSSLVETNAGDSLEKKEHARAEADSST